MASFEEIREIQLKEHTVQYEYFTRLMLSLSVGFITFTTALKGNETDVSYLYQIGIAFHALSILFGIWLQYILVNRPLDDLKKISKKMSAPNYEQDQYFASSPSRTEQFCFLAQIVFFLVAFFMVVIGVLI
jgi:hypothetical protein